jgi:hypothetical protein
MARTEEHIFTIETALHDRLSDKFLVSIHDGRIDVSVTNQPISLYTQREHTYNQL